MEESIAAGYDFGSVENFTGSKFNDTLVGTTANNTLNGGSGDDYLYGGDGERQAGRGKRH
jgi:Ca2+-binding RTX toxin-like protein